jgi:hypothetical protein
MLAALCKVCGAPSLSWKGPDVTSQPGADVFAAPPAGAAAPAVQADHRLPAAPASDDMFDPGQILASVGEVPYQWRVDTGRLLWGANLADVLKVDAIASGAAYAALVGQEHRNTVRRGHAVGTA